MKNYQKNFVKDDNTSSAQYKEKFTSAWITEGINNDTILYAEELGRMLAEGPFKMTTSQIRNFFGEVKRIQMSRIENNKPAFLLLKPKLAYAATRADKRQGITLFKNVMESAIDAVQIDQLQNASARFQNFCDFLEAVLAYHKAAGGKEN